MNSKQAKKIRQFMRDRYQAVIDDKAVFDYKKSMTDLKTKLIELSSIEPKLKGRFYMAIALAAIEAVIIGFLVI